jgi:hypothetical protein
MYIRIWHGLKWHSKLLRSREWWKETRRKFDEGKKTEKKRKVFIEPCEGNSYQGIREECYLVNFVIKFCSITKFVINLLAAYATSLTTSLLKQPTIIYRIWVPEFERIHFPPQRHRPSSVSMLGFYNMAFH